MKLQQTLKSPRTWLAISLYGVSAVIGLIWGYDFGARVGGTLGGVMAALCSAVFCTLLADGLASRVLRKPRR